MPWHQLPLFIRVNQMVRVTAYIFRTNAGSHPTCIRVPSVWPCKSLVGFFAFLVAGSLTLGVYDKYLSISFGSTRLYTSQKYWVCGVLAADVLLLSCGARTQILVQSRMLIKHLSFDQGDHPVDDRRKLSTRSFTNS